MGNLFLRSPNQIRMLSSPPAFSLTSLSLCLQLHVLSFPVHPLPCLPLPLFPLYPLNPQHFTRRRGSRASCAQQGLAGNTWEDQAGKWNRPAVTTAAAVPNWKGEELLWSFPCHQPGAVAAAGGGGNVTLKAEGKRGCAKS